MVDLFSAENIAEMQKAIDELSYGLEAVFTEEEKKNCSLHFEIARAGHRQVDDFSSHLAKDLISWGKSGGSTTCGLKFLRHRFIGKPREIDIAKFSIVQLPGCCAVAVSTGAFTNQEFRRRGIGTLLNKFRIALARCQGYAQLVCTAVDDGITERILGKNGWKKDASFVNKRTENPISMFRISLL